MVSRGVKPLVSFSTKGDAWNFMWEKVREFDLCPKLSGLQVAKGLCFSYQTSECKGACMGVESVKKYNKRIKACLDSFLERGNSLAIVGVGRRNNERSLVLVENGTYLGFGFIDKKATLNDFESAKDLIKIGKENRIVQNLVNSYLVNPRGAEVIEF
jgi:DNA polymerase-3 subunit epsilon